jgi:hypothetical protein
MTPSFRDYRSNKQRMDNDGPVHSLRTQRYELLHKSITNILDTSMFLRAREVFFKYEFWTTTRFHGGLELSIHRGASNTRVDIKRRHWSLD